MAKPYRAVIALLIVIHLVSILVGGIMAIFGSQSDVGQYEQLAALLFGIAMIAFGVGGLVFVARPKSKEGLRAPLFCAGGATISFLLVLAFGP